MGAADITDIEFDEIPSAAPSWGGAREGAGRPKGKPDRKLTQAKRDLESSRGRHEAAKADLAELELARQLGQYVQREGFAVASATAIASFAQAVRSIQDTLEREGFEPQLCQRVGDLLDSALGDLSGELSMFTTEPADVG